MVVISAQVLRQREKGRKKKGKNVRGRSAEQKRNTEKQAGPGTGKKKVEGTTQKKPGGKGVRQTGTLKTSVVTPH